MSMPTGLGLVAWMLGVLLIAYQVAWYFRAGGKPADWVPPTWATMGMMGGPVDRDAFRVRLLIGVIPIAILLCLSFFVPR